jgi:outer membrane protein OmpA-like peptidoglycan-associated protein
MKNFFSGLLLLALVAQVSFGQSAATEISSAFNRDGRWSLGFRGGANLWFNDFDTRKISAGGELYLRYAISRRFSLGVMGSYDALQANQRVLYAGTPLQYDYIEDKGMSADLVAWFHFTTGNSFAPYVYLGVGSYQYKRKVINSLYYPDGKTYVSIHIPAGLGIDVMFSKYVGFNIDVGARFMDDLTDYWKGDLNKIGIIDLYATAKAGIHFYIGSSGSDDNDGDGLTNDEEEAMGIDPDNPDTDGDGLRDGEELRIYKTNPKNPDSDGDGLKDGVEVNIYKTNPNNADTDGDGLSGGDELFKYNTDPLKADSDGDGLSDGNEIMKYMTDPLKADTDGDGLKDGDELNIYKTNPLKADTDGGSVSDGQEVTNKTNPLDPNDDVRKPKVELGQAIILEGIVFQSGKAAIDPNSEKALMQALQTMRDNADIVVEIRGYTDNVGTAATNQLLSERRAEAVRFWLIKNGIAASRITPRGFGSAYPIGDNNRAEGRAMNRRIEFLRTK